MKRWLNPERERWLRENYSRSPIPETVKRFNDLFGAAVTATQMKNANGKYRFGRSRRQGVMRVLNAEEIAWMREHFSSGPRKDIQARFATKFGRTLSLAQLDNIGVRLDLRGAPNVGRFGDYRVPENKGRRGWSQPGSEKGWFQKGNRAARALPMYSERWESRGRKGTKVLLIKVPGGADYQPKKKDYVNHKWVRKAVWAWTEANGPVPRGHAVVQLDGDPANCDPANLDCVEKAVLALLNNSAAPKPAGPGINPARVRLAQTRVAISKRKREVL